MENKKQGIIFARVSSRAQELEGFSLDAQIKLLKDYAERNGIHIKRVFKVSETASRVKDRQAFNECLEYLRKHRISCLVVEKADRMTRNFHDYIKVDEWLNADDKRELHALKNGMVLSKNSKSQEKFMWSIWVAMAKNMTDNLSEEVKKGQIEKLNQGWLPNEPPLGYNTIIVDGKRVHEVDPETSRLIVKGFELYASPAGTLTAVADKLAKLGLKTRHGGVMNKNAVDKMLDNKFYIGINCWNGIEYQGKQEPIISEELWEAVQRKKHGEEPKAKYKKHAALLRGLVTCKHCGKLIVWQMQKGRYYGRCNSKCKIGSYAREEDVVAELLKIVERSMAKSDELYDWVRSELQGYVRSHNASVLADRTKLEKLIAQQRTKQDVLYDDKLEGIITADDYTRRAATLKVNIKELENELETLNVSREYISESSIKVVAICQQAKSRYDTGNQELQREILSFYFDGIVWNGHKLHAELSELAKLVILLAETIQKAKQKVEPQSDLCNVGSSEPARLSWQGHVESNHDLGFWRPLY